MAMRIFVGEDSPVEQQLLSAILSGLPEVYFFPDGLSLYQAVLTQQPSLVITDILMPRLTGLALCKLVRGHSRLQSTRILCISSITEPHIRERSLSAGADAFLPKPIDVLNFEGVVTRLLEETLLGGES